MTSSPPKKSRISALTDLFPKTPEGKPKFITEPDEFNSTMEALSETQGLCNLLCAITYVDYIPPVQAVSLRVIPSKEDMWYKPSFGKGDLALKGEALATLFREAGGSYRPSQRLDDGKDRLYCHMKAVVVMRAMNGIDAPFSKDRELDLRPGAPETEAMRDRETGKMRDQQLANAQQTILRVCETKAQLRAIRTALGAKQLYKPAQAALPFVIPTLVPNPDMSNPQHVGFMLAHSMGAVDQVFGKQKALPPGSIEDTPHGPVDTSTGELLDNDLPGDPAEANDIAGGDFDGPEIVVCTCPCGCASVVDEEYAAQTAKRRGVVRCPECYPGRGFEESKHKSLASLQMNPDVTVKQALSMKAEALKKAKA